MLWHRHVVTLQWYDIMMLWHRNVIKLPCYDITMLWHYHAMTLPCYEITMLWHYNAMTLQCYDIAMLWHYYVTTLQCNNISTLQCTKFRFKHTYFLATSFLSICLVSSQTFDLIKSRIEENLSIKNKKSKSISISLPCNR